MSAVDSAYREPNARCKRCGMGFYYGQGECAWFCASCLRWMSNWESLGLDSLRETVWSDEKRWDKQRIANIRQMLERAYWKLTLTHLEKDELDVVIDRLSAENQALREKGAQG